MTIEVQIREFLKHQDYKNCSKFLIDNTGIDKQIKPGNINELERYYSLLYEELRNNGKHLDLFFYTNIFLNHMIKLEKKDGAHYHKGLGYHNSGISLYRLALSQFLNAFIEDAITTRKNLPLTPGRQELQCLFKANEDDLEKLGKHTIESSKTGIISPEEILKNYIGHYGEPYTELWQVETNISQIEKDIRNCISRILGQGWLDNETFLNKGKKEEIIGRQIQEKKILGKAASDSLIDYLNFSDYALIVKHNQNLFNPIFGDINEFADKMEKLRYIRNKIAHFRKIFKEDIDEVNRIRKYLGDGLEKGLNLKREDISSQHWDSKAFATSGNTYTACIYVGLIRVGVIG